MVYLPTRSFGFHCDPQLHDLNVLYLRFFTLYSSFSWGTDTISPAPSNKPPEGLDSGFTLSLVLSLHSCMHNEQRIYLPNIYPWYRRGFSLACSRLLIGVILFPSHESKGPKGTKRSGTLGTRSLR